MIYREQYRLQLRGIADRGNYTTVWYVLKDNGRKPERFSRNLTKRLFHRNL